MITTNLFASEHCRGISHWPSTSRTHIQCMGFQVVTNNVDRDDQAVLLAWIRSCKDTSMALDSILYMLFGTECRSRVASSASYSNHSTSCVLHLMVVFRFRKLRKWLYFPMVVIKASRSFLPMLTSCRQDDISALLWICRKLFVVTRKTAQV